MGRSILAVIVSYITMFVLNLIGFSVFYALLGQDQVFRPHSYLASNRWIAIFTALVFITGVIGGLICAVIARGGKATLALAVVVLVLGFLLAIPSVIKHQRNANLIRPANVPSLEALQLAHWPVWAPVVFPIVGAIGVMIGGKLKKRS